MLPNFMLSGGFELYEGLDRPVQHKREILHCSLGIFQKYCLNTDVLNPLKPSGNYMSHLLQQSLPFHFLFMGFVRFSL
jgi:hypothetical protein